MRPRLPSFLLSCALVLGLVSAASASTGSGAVVDAGSSESCYASTDGTCSGEAAAERAGTLSAAVELTSPDSPLGRSTRYSQALARHTIGFDLAAPTRAAAITVDLRVDEASAEWTQATPELFGGSNDARSGARILFQLIGSAAPGDCGCGWFIQGSPNVTVAQVTDAGTQSTATDRAVSITMNASDPYGDGFLPAGHYEVLLRSYALAELFGTGDWGSLSASVDGAITNVTVTTPDEVTKVASNLELSVANAGSKRTLTATLTDESGRPIDGRTISFFGDGKSLGSAVTEGGVATIPLDKKLRGGSHLFAAEFAGDEAYEASSAETRS